MGLMTQFEVLGWWRSLVTAAASNARGYRGIPLRVWPLFLFLTGSVPPVKQDIRSEVKYAGTPERMQSLGQLMATEITQERAGPFRGTSISQGSHGTPNFPQQNGVLRTESPMQARVSP
jgi:hypothetical protein